MNKVLWDRRITRLSIALKDLFTDPLIVNAACYFSFGKQLQLNWGDDLNFLFLQEIVSKPLSPFLFAHKVDESVHLVDLYYRKNQENFCIIGSIIEMLSNEDSIIWGAGIMGNLPMKKKPKKVLAVRGPLSRDYLMRKGIDCPPVYGDPMMLAKYYYQPICRKKKYKIGLIPHFLDKNHPSLSTFASNPNVQIIDIQNYGKWTSIIDRIVECEYIVSSSLHGLIAAETYNIPNLWVEFFAHESHFKYHDFFLSMGKDRCNPYIINEETTYSQILFECTKYKKSLGIDLRPLVDISPLPLKNIQIKE